MNPRPLTIDELNARFGKPDAFRRGATCTGGSAAVSFVFEGTHSALKGVWAAAQQAGWTPGWRRTAPLKATGGHTRGLITLWTTDGTVGYYEIPAERSLERRPEIDLYPDEIIYDVSAEELTGFFYALRLP